MMSWLIKIALAAETTVTPSTYDNVPVSLQESITRLFQFAYGIAGFLAFAMILYSGVRYVISAANPSQKADAKDGIVSALLGLLLLISAYVILYTINPEIVAQNPIPKLKQIQQVQVSQTGAGACSNCSTMPSSICTETANVHCGAAGAVSAKLQTLMGSYTAFHVTEGYPAVGTHSDPAHSTGCAIDVKVNINNCTEVQKFIAAASSTGFRVTNEYVRLGCPGAKKTTYATGDHVHLNGCN